MIEIVYMIEMHGTGVKMKLCPVFYIFHPFFIKFETEYIHNIILTDCELRESRFSEKRSSLYLEAEINFYPKVSHLLPY